MASTPVRESSNVAEDVRFLSSQMEDTVKIVRYSDGEVSMKYPSDNVTTKGDSGMNTLTTGELSAPEVKYGKSGELSTQGKVDIEVENLSGAYAQGGARPKIQPRMTPRPHDVVKTKLAFSELPFRETPLSVYGDNQKDYVAGASNWPERSPGHDSNVDLSLPPPLKRQTPITSVDTNPFRSFQSGGQTDGSLFPANRIYHDPKSTQVVVTNIKSTVVESPSASYYRARTTSSGVRRASPTVTLYGPPTSHTGVTSSYSMAPPVWPNPYLPYMYGQGYPLPQVYPNVNTLEGVNHAHMPIPGQMYSQEGQSVPFIQGFRGAFQTSRPASQRGSDVNNDPSKHITNPFMSENQTMVPGPYPLPRVASRVASPFVPIANNSNVMVPYGSHLVQSPVPVHPLTTPVAPSTVPPQTRTHSVENIPNFPKLSPYDGTSHWPDFRTQFEIIASINNWSSSTKAVQLIALLRKDALSTLTDLDSDERSYEKIIEALNMRFDPPHQAGNFRDKLHDRIRKPKESVTELAHDIRRLVKKAYPEANAQIREVMAIDSFRKALNDVNFEWAVKNKDPTTLNEALQIALKYDTFHANRTQPNLSLRSTTVLPDVTPEVIISEKVNLLSSDVAATMAENARLTEEIKRLKEGKSSQRPYRFQGECWYCEKKGHKKFECRKRQYDEKNGIEPPQKSQNSKN
ncbi:unnamed protein product [Owenia fusiformis]|uniref:Uncharacterized protein n=1 Tax=Owenia fusiformis TaxID=6347 RepID=A0A8J1TGE6_OWEFU|nr:unnamed protein product [Owenia fusiformis]